MSGLLHNLPDPAKMSTEEFSAEMNKREKLAFQEWLQRDTIKFLVATIPPSTIPGVMRAVLWSAFKNGSTFGVDMTTVLIMTSIMEGQRRDKS